MKKIIIAAVVALLPVFCANAQTNIQLHYDMGSYLYHGQGSKADLGKNAGNRQVLTTTIEHWNADRFGSNFFFIDVDFTSDPLAKFSAVRGAYTEISREWCFWGDSKLKDLTFHMEYNGGLDRYSKSYNDAWLFGPTYNFHNGDYSFTASISALYKVIPGNAKNVNNFQLTGVWNWTFYKGMFKFSGFADLWMENRPWQIYPTVELASKLDKKGDGTDLIFISEPQFWFNLNAVQGCEDVNLSFGTELELSNNFVGTGFYACPTLGVKYTF